MLLILLEVKARDKETCITMKLMQSGRRVITQYLKMMPLALSNVPRLQKERKNNVYHSAVTTAFNTLSSHCVWFCAAQGQKMQTRP